MKFTITIASINAARKLMHKALVITAACATFTSLPVSASAPGIEIPIQQRNNLSDTPDVIQYTLNPQDALYPETFMVTNITQETGNPNWILELTCSNGNVFLYESEDGDWCMGDYASAIMADSGTMKVIDDRILKLTYAGYEGCDAWAYVSERKYNVSK